MPIFYGDEPMISKLGLALLISLALAGCGEKKEAVQGTGANAKPSPASLMNSPKLPDSPAPPTAQAPVLPKPDRTLPLASYVDLNGEAAGLALTYIVSAKAQAPLSDDEKLSRLSPAYFNETDAFKKKEVAKAEMPRVDAALSKYRKHDYYAVPVSAYSRQPLGLTNVSVGQYDFSTRSFPLASYGQDCWTGTLRNPQGVVLKILQSDIPCRLPVADEAQAKLIEAARAQNALGLQGTLYLFVPRAENGTALAVVSRAHIELINSQTQAPLGSFDL